MDNRLNRIINSPDEIKAHGSISRTYEWDCPDGITLNVTVWETREGGREFEFDFEDSNGNAVVPDAADVGPLNQFVEELLLPFGDTPDTEAEGESTARTRAEEVYRLVNEHGDAADSGDEDAVGELQEAYGSLTPMDVVVVELDGSPNTRTRMVFEREGHRQYRNPINVRFEWQDRGSPWIEAYVVFSRRQSAVQWAELVNVFGD